jgi:hypothetical protein
VKNNIWVIVGVITFSATVPTFAANVPGAIAVASRKPAPGTHAVPMVYAMNNTCALRSLPVCFRRSKTGQNLPHDLQKTLHFLLLTPI